MDLILVYGFTAAVIGGLDSPVGALVGGLVTGLSLCPAWAATSAASLEPLAALALVIVSLMIRPGGHLRPTRPPGGSDATVHQAAACRRSPPGLVPPARASRCFRHWPPAPSWPAVGFSSSPTGLSAFNDYELGQIAFYVIASPG